MYWCFNEEQLTSALRAYEADRVDQEGTRGTATSDEKEVIRRFLTSPAAQQAKIVMGLKSESRDGR